LAGLLATPFGGVQQSTQQHQPAANKINTARTSAEEQQTVSTWQLFPPLSLPPPIEIPFLKPFELPSPESLQTSPPPPAPPEVDTEAIIQTVSEEVDFH
jgi:hypothetical protein